MQAYRTLQSLPEDGVIVLRDLPFKSGTKVEVIVLEDSKPSKNESRYPLWGAPLEYIDPTAPAIPESDWKF